MDGAKVAAWNKWVCIIAFSLVAFLFYWFIINKDGTLVEAVHNMKVVTMFGLMGLFAVLSGGIWLYFLWREKHLPKQEAEKQET